MKLFTTTLILFLLNTFTYAQIDFECKTELLPEQIDYNNDIRPQKEIVSFDNWRDAETIYVPLAIHIIRGNYKQGGLTNDELSQAMLDLNATFKQAQFEFGACIVNYIDEDEYFFAKIGQSFEKDTREYDMTKDNLVNGYLNIFFVPNISGCGWSSFPGFKNLEDPKDWIVMNNFCATNGSTLAHEIGHYFDLYHTHQGKYTFGEIWEEELVSRHPDTLNCGANVGDELCDTPAEPTVNELGKSGISGLVDTINCAYTGNKKDIKGHKYVPDTRNLMSYSQKFCRDFISPEQIARMRTSYEVDRNYLLNVCDEIITQTEPCRVRDSLALIALYNATNGANWIDKWDLNKSMNEWKGVYFDNNNCVNTLSLVYRNLEGQIPEEIGDLKDLTYLNLDFNKVNGSIPSSIGNLTKLNQIHLVGNNIEGNIPYEIGHLNNVHSIKLQGNNLSGIIPKSLKYLPKLRTLFLNDNNFEGDIPEEITTLPLSLVTFNNNKLSGCYKPHVAKLCTKSFLKNNSERVSDGNNFDATWVEFCNSGKGMCTDGSRMTDSLALVAVYNAINGSNSRYHYWNLNGPMNYWKGVTLNNNGRATSLQFVYDYGIDGYIPPEVGDLTYLNHLRFSSTNVTGPIPKEIGNLSNLERVTFDYANFGDANLPEEIGNLNKLKYLTFQSTELGGELPTSLGNLQNLKALHFTGNNLTGNLPVELSELAKLNSVRLCANKLEGCFDPSFKKWCSWALEYPNCISSNEEWETNNFDATWEEFCNQNLGICDNAGDYKTGDYNNDGIVNNADVLYLGLAYGYTGPKCENSNQDLTNCVDWDNEVNGVNAKYQDGDGNGVVDFNDLKSIETNYENAASAFNNNTKIPDNYSFNLEKVSETPIKLIYNLNVKNAQQQDISTYGLVCNINLGKFNSSDVEVDFSQSSLEPTLSISKYNPFTNVLDLALSRADKKNKLCNGPIAQIVIFIEEIDTDDGYSIDIFDGSTVLASGLESDINSVSYDVANDGGFAKLGIIKDELNIMQSSNGIVMAEFKISRPYKKATINMYDLNSRLLKSHSISNNDNGRIKMTIENVEPGMYLYSLVVDNAVLVTKKGIIGLVPY